MNKTELINAIANNINMSKADAKTVLDSAITVITNTLADGDSINITGFGSFAVRDRVARIGRNPKTGEQIQIAASKVPAFKAGKSLKDAVNKGQS